MTVPIANGCALTFSIRAFIDIFCINSQIYSLAQIDPHIYMSIHLYIYIHYIYFVCIHSVGPSLVATPFIMWKTVSQDLEKMAANADSRGSEASESEAGGSSDVG